MHLVAELNFKKFDTCFEINWDTVTNPLLFVNIPSTIFMLFKAYRGLLPNLIFKS